MKSLQVFFIVLALTVVLGGAFTNKKAEYSTATPPSASPSPIVLSEATEAPSPSLAPVASPTATKVPVATEVAISQNSPMLIYPGAKIISQTSAQTILESESSGGDVSKWYQSRLREIGMRALAISQNTINGNFLAKISAAENNRKYDIEIKQDQSASITTIILR